MLEKKIKSELSDDDFIESVIHKVRKYERGKKHKRAVIGGAAFFGVLLFVGLQPLDTPENAVHAKSFDGVTSDLMRLNEVNLGLPDDFALDAGKPCSGDMACENC